MPPNDLVQSSGAGDGSTLLANDFQPSPQVLESLSAIPKVTNSKRARGVDRAEQALYPTRGIDETGWSSTPVSFVQKGLQEA